MNKKELKRDLELFDAGDVTWEIEETKRRDQIKIILSTETSFNLMKTYLSLKMICEKIEVQLGIMEETEGEH
jgi:hypothetical protein